MQTTALNRGPSGINPEQYSFRQSNTRSVYDTRYKAFAQLFGKPCFNVFGGDSTDTGRGQFVDYLSAGLVVHQP
jgi:hypothetical protein